MKPQKKLCIHLEAPINTNFNIRDPVGLASSTLFLETGYIRQSCFLLKCCQKKHYQNLIQDIPDYPINQKTALKT